MVEAGLCGMLKVGVCFSALKSESKEEGTESTSQQHFFKSKSFLALRSYNRLLDRPQIEVCFDQETMRSKNSKTFSLVLLRSRKKRQS